VLQLQPFVAKRQDFWPEIALREGWEKMIENLLKPMHLLVIFIIALLIFGPKKLPELGKGLGEGLRHFKDALSGKGNGDSPRQG
jgi:sec-independent protein translocase protein TatA